MQYNLYKITYICGIKNFHNPLQYWIILPFILLADQFNVPQFAKVEVSLLLQIFNSKFQYIDLSQDINDSLSTKEKAVASIQKAGSPKFSERWLYAKHFRNNQDTGERQGEVLRGRKGLFLKL